MQKTFLIVSVLLLAITGQAQSPGNFKLQVRLPATANGKVYLSWLADSANYKRDSVMVNGGSVSFSGTIPHTSLARLFFGGKQKQIFLEPSTTIHVAAESGDLSTSRVSGSKTQEEFEKLDSALSRITKRWKIVMDTLSAINKRSNFLYQEYKEWVLSPYFEEVKETQLAFYEKYPDSYVTAFYLTIYGMDLTTDSLKLLYGRLSKPIQQSSYGKNIGKQLEDRNIGIPGAIAAGFAAPDLNGKKLELAQFKGKYVLLDFWGSWCLPCRKTHPHLKTLYGKYRQRGIEFIGVAQEYNNNKETWLKAVKEDQLDWPQIMTVNTPEGDLVRKYNIDYFPTKILIGKDGVIIGRFGEKDMAKLDSMLENIFK